MSIDNSISLKRIKKALPPKTVAMVLVIVAILSAIFYFTAQNRNKKEVLIWYVTTDAEAGFSENSLKIVNDYGAQKGFDRILLSKRHPEDGYFDALMSTTAYYTCDIFVMKSSEAQKYMEMDMFMTIKTDSKYKDLLFVEDIPIGVPFEEDYYLMINKKTNVDIQMIYDIIDILIENK